MQKTSLCILLRVNIAVMNHHTKNNLERIHLNTPDDSPSLSKVRARTQGPQELEVGAV